MSLETGSYGIASVNFTTGKPVSRFLGVGADSKIVLLPEGYAAEKWEIEKLNNGNYLIRILNNRYAKAEGKDVRVVEDDKYEWHIIRGAPSPAPIGKDNFGILVPGHPNPQRSWETPKTDHGNAAHEVPIFIGDVASSIHIFKL